MSTYIGYYRPDPSFMEEGAARARSGGAAFEPRFLQLVVELPAKLPAGCTVVGSYTPTGGSPDSPPSVMIVDTADSAHLQFISQYYAGYLNFQWVPAAPVGANAQQREQWRESVSGPAAASVT